MAIAFDSISTLASGTGTLSWTHTPVGSPVKGVLVFAMYAADTDLITGATYGGIPMTELTGSPLLHSNAVEPGSVHGFFLGSDVPDGPQTVEVTVSAGGIKGARSVALTADAGVEIVDIDTSINSNSVANPSVVLSLGGRTSFAMIGFFSGQDAATGITPLAGWTGNESDLGISTVGWYTYDTVGSADVTAGWTQAADDAAMIAVAVSEVQISALSSMLLGVG